MVSVHQQLHLCASLQASPAACVSLTCSMRKFDLQQAF